VKTLEEWMLHHLAGRRVLQVHCLGLPDHDLATAATRVGAASVTVMDPTPADAPAWAEVKARVAAAGGALECLPRHLFDSSAEHRDGPRRWEVVWSAQAPFHDADPYRWVRRLADLSEEVVVIRTTRLPEIPGVLREGEMIHAMLDDPRLPAIRAVLQARGVTLSQFEAVGQPRDWGGSHVEGMWCWFFTAGAVEDMLRDCGFLPEWRFAEWGDLAATIIGRRA
jgi:hypothetical protein